MFGRTAVEVLHRTYLYLLLRARYLFASAVLTVRCPNRSIYRSKSRGNVNIFNINCIK